MTPQDPTNHCDELREHLPLLIYPDELVGEELAAVEDHLVVCSECAELHAQQLEVAARLRPCAWVDNLLALGRHEEAG